MTDKILIDRAVVEQALEAFELHADQYPHMVKGYTLDAAEALRAALEQPVEQETTCKDCLQVPDGFVLLQTEAGQPVYAACLDGGRFNGWLMWKHHDGQWVSKRKLEPWELMQVEDQRDYGIVQGD